MANETVHEKERNILIFTVRLNSPHQLPAYLSDSAAHASKTEARLRIFQPCLLKCLSAKIVRFIKNAFNFADVNVPGQPPLGWTAAGGGFTYGHILTQSTACSMDPMQRRCRPTWEGRAGPHTQLLATGRRAPAPLV